MAAEKVRRILIVDNDEDFLTRLQVLFEDRDYQTTVAWGGREVLRELEADRFDLVLLNDYLPDVNCEEFWKDFGRLAGSASVALLRTDPPVEPMAARYAEAGGRCVLSKSAPHKIVEMVRECLSTDESRRLNQTSDAPGREGRKASARTAQKGQRRPASFRSAVWSLYPRLNVGRL